MPSQTIIYPLFAECQSYTLDNFWKDVFLGCACNKFPRGMRYDSQTDTATVKTHATINHDNTEIIDIPQTPEVAFQILMEMLE